MSSSDVLSSWALSPAQLSSRKNKMESGEATALPPVLCGGLVGRTRGESRANKLGLPSIDRSLGRRRTTSLSSASTRTPSPVPSLEPLRGSSRASSARNNSRSDSKGSLHSASSDRVSSSMPLSLWQNMPVQGSSTSSVLDAIARMRPSEIDSVLNRILSLHETRPEDIPQACQALVRRVIDLISRTPLHALSQAGDLVQSMLQKAWMNPAFDGIMEKLPHVLEARLEQLVYEKNLDGDSNPVDPLIDKYEQAVQLRQRALVTSKLEDIVISNLRRWLEKSPMSQIQKHAAAVVRAVDVDRSLRNTLADRFRRVEFSKQGPEQMKYCAWAVRELQKLDVDVLDDATRANYAEQLDALIKSCGMERLSNELDPVNKGGVAALCQSSEVMAESVRNRVSDRLRKFLATKLGATRTNEDLPRLQTEFDVWHRLVIHGQRLGVVVFSYPARDAVLEAFSACFGKLMELPTSTASTDAVEMLSGMQWKVMCLMGGAALERPRNSH